MHKDIKLIQILNKYQGRTTLERCHKASLRDHPNTENQTEKDNNFRDSVCCSSRPAPRAGLMAEFKKAKTSAWANGYRSFFMAGLAQISKNRVQSVWKHSTNQRSIGLHELPPNYPAAWHREQQLQEPCGHAHNSSAWSACIQSF